LLAFHTGDRAMLLWSTLYSPQTHSYEQAVAVLEDLLAMPGHEDLQEHYRYAQDSLLPKSVRK
jgi:alpha-galactosidase